MCHILVSNVAQPANPVEFFRFFSWNKYTTLYRLTFFWGGGHSYVYPCIVAGLVIAGKHSTWLYISNNIMLNVLIMIHPILQAFTKSFSIESGVRRNSTFIKMRTAGRPWRFLRMRYGLNRLAETLNAAVIMACFSASLTARLWH